MSSNVDLPDLYDFWSHILKECALIDPTVAQLLAGSIPANVTGNVATIDFESGTFGRMVESASEHVSKVLNQAIQKALADYHKDITPLVFHWRTP